MEHRRRIGNVRRNALNADDRDEIARLLSKTGYSVHLIKEKPAGRNAYEYFVEFWDESNRNGQKIYCNGRDGGRQLNEAERLTLGWFLQKAGYTVKQGDEKQKTTTVYYVEYWREDECKGI